MTLLGHDPQGQNVWIYPKDRLTGCYVIGANGTGKSTLLLNMISQDIEQGFGVCLLDPHGDLTNAVVNRIPDKRINDVILLNPLDVDYPFGLNLFTCSDMQDPAKVEHSVEQIVQIFSKVFGMGVETPRLNQYVRHIAYSLVGSGYTMCEIPLLLLDKAFRDKVITNVSSTATKLFWKAFDGLRPTEQLERSESTLDRIDSLISNSIIRNIVGQTHTSINFRNIMDSGKILLVSLSAQYESLTSLLGSICIGQLLTAALSRASSSKRRQFNLYADEYQRFATPDFATLLTEARKFGVATTIAHQVRSQLDEKNAATALQAGSLVCFRVTSEDADELAAEFDCTPPPGDLIERPVRSYATNVVKELCEHGHADALTRQVIEDIFIPLYTHPAGKGKEGDFADVGEVGSIYSLYKRDYDEALKTLNTLWSGVMEHKISILSEAFRNLLFSVLQSLRCYLRLVAHSDHVRGIPKDAPTWSEPYNFTLAAKYMIDHIYDLDGENGKKTYDAATDIRVDYHIHTHPGYPEVAKKDAQRDCDKIFDFIMQVYTVAEGLFFDPIVVSSGKYEQVEGPRMTYNDRKNQIANELVLLKRGHARVRLPGGEYLMETIPDTSSHAQSTKKAQIIDYTRKNYCNLRQEVEEEIRARQERDEPPTSKRRGSV